MIRLFVLEVMNLVWVAALAVVLLEKLAPRGLRLAAIAGVVLVPWGAYMLVRPAFG